MRFLIIFLGFVHLCHCNKIGQGLISAFGDFNADKHTDILAIGDEGSSVKIYYSDNENGFNERKLLGPTELYNLKLSSVVPADFDGDLQMDLLITFADKTQPSRIYWGEDSGVTQTQFLQLPDMVDQPIVMDYNADMIPDLFGEKTAGERYFWIMSNTRSVLREIPMAANNETKYLPLWSPQTSAFIDLDSDLTADLCIVSKDNDKPQLEFWLNKGGKYEKTSTYGFMEGDFAVIGQISFADLDGDLLVDAVVPVCVDADCKDSQILVLPSGYKKWTKVGGNYNSGPYKFIGSSMYGSVNVYPVLRLGDYDLDGYLDIVTVMKKQDSTETKTVMLYNRNAGGNVFSRKFDIEGKWLDDGEQSDVLVAAFFDLFENGILDLVVSSNNVSDITTRKQEFINDACFIKVTVVSGRCNYNCPDGRQPYGVNQPGPTIRYKTTDLHGQLQHKICYQLSQSAYLPLQLPYCVFGLGLTPNFVDTLEVGIPTNSSVKLQKDWTSVIPNSQLLIIPYPIHDPSSWTNKLFVTPSRLMMLTGASLLGTCGFIAGVIAILHWRDKVEDKKEKRQESQRFHFDAM